MTVVISSGISRIEIAVKPIGTLDVINGQRRFSGVVNHLAIREAASLRNVTDTVLSISRTSRKHVTCSIIDSRVRYSLAR